MNLHIVIKLNFMLLIRALLGAENCMDQWTDLFFYPPATEEVIFAEHV